MFLKLFLKTIWGTQSCSLVPTMSFGEQNFDPLFPKRVLKDRISFPCFRNIFWGTEFRSLVPGMSFGEQNFVPLFPECRLGNRMSFPCSPKSSGEQEHWGTCSLNFFGEHVPQKVFPKIFGEHVTLKIVTIMQLVTRQMKRKTQLIMWFDGKNCESF